MQESDKRHFWECLQGLATSTKGELTTGVLKVYWVALEDLPLADFDKAIKRAVFECTYFPSVQELRELAGHPRKAQRVPHYLGPVEDELERIETCSFHATRPRMAAPDHVPWCRKCRRLRLAANGNGRPQAIGDILRQAALVPLDPKGDSK